MSEYDSNEIVIGTPVSMTKIKDVDEYPADEILVSYGGGMGGANHTYHAFHLEEQGDSEIKIKTLDNRWITLNKRFIVSIEPVRIAEVEFDTTAYANYGNKVCQKEIRRVWYAFRGNESFCWKEDYQGSLGGKNESEVKRCRVLSETIRK
jgi:hypothetical protein